VSEQQGPTLGDLTEKDHDTVGPYDYDNEQSNRDAREL